MPSLLRLLGDRFPDIDEKELFARIVCGEISLAGETVRDPKRRVSAEGSIEWKTRRFVSRGGDKLAAALSEWSLPVSGLVFVDAGASTGGFTDCLLQAGARLVHSVDVGYNQLDFRLRRDARVIVHERTNLMELTSLDPVPDAGVADLSFRSLRGAASRLLSLTRRRWGVVLVKPQFELAASAAGADFDGVVRDHDQLVEALCSVQDQLRFEGITVRRALVSPIPGRRGNREVLFLVDGSGVFPDLAEVEQSELRRRIASLSDIPRQIS